MKLLTGNDLHSGLVIWWTGDGWSTSVGDAVDVGDAGEQIAAVESAARRVNGAYVADAETTPDGPRPLHIKERIRAYGPTVRADLSHSAAPAAANWVI